MNRRQRAITGTDVLIVVVLGIAVLTVMLPKWHVEGVLQREDHTMATITYIAERTLESRGSGGDADEDGRGEIRGFLPEAVDELEHVDRGIYRDDAYYYAVLLPGVDRYAVIAGSPAVPTDHAEAAFAVVAWPSEPGTSGMRAYLWSESDGVLRHAVDGYPYGGPDRPPLPDSPLITSEAGGGGTAPLKLRSKFWVTPREMRGAGKQQ